MSESHTSSDSLTDLDVYDPQIIGVKGLVFIGERILIYRRDTNTDSYPLALDLPGGGPEGTETPYQTFRREVGEEFGLTVERENIVYVHKYASATIKDRIGCFVVAKLNASAEQQIVFGSEGVEFLLIDRWDYLSRTDAWPLFQERTLDYLHSTDYQEQVSD